MMTSEPEFVTKYLDRIGLDPAMFDPSTPRDYQLLSRLSEAHLSSIPFENLSQHGGYGGPVQLDMKWISDKILDRKRGGFCLELNALFAAFLEAWGFKVAIVPAIVYNSDDGGFEHPPSHIILLVTLPTDGGPHSYFVDVGFGEPPCQPLVYEFEKVQITSEGMASRLMENDGKVSLDWFKDKEWRPRLQWNLEDGSRSRSIEELSELLDRVYSPDSIFSRKLIVCRLLRDQKLTLAGDKLKVTGPPRYTNDTETVNVKITQLDSKQGIRDALAKQFGIPLDETKNLDVEQIVKQDPKLFAQF